MKKSKTSNRLYLFRKAQNRAYKIGVLTIWNTSNMTNMEDILLQQGRKIAKENACVMFALLVFFIGLVIMANYWPMVWAGIKISYQTVIGMF